MNKSQNPFPGMMPKVNPTYDRAQQAVGAPATESLQVDDSIDALSEAVEFHVETVQMLLRRLHPVTGDFAVPIEEDTKLAGSWKVPLAQRIDSRVERMVALTADVQNVIRALQV